MHDEARRRRVLVVGSLGSAVSAFDLSLMFVTYPSIRAAFPDVSLTKVSFVLTSYTIVAAALLIPAGRLADRIGRSRAFTIGLSLFAIGTSAAALSPTIDILIGARVIQAAGGAFITPSSIGLVLSVFPPERRSAALGIWSSVTSGLSSGAPIFGSLVIRAGGWRWAFVLALPLCLICLVLGRKALEPEQIDRSQPYPDPLGALMIAIALAALAYGIVQTTTWGWTDGRVAATLAVPLLLGPPFLLRCRRHPAPIIDFAIVSRSAGFKGMAAYSIGVGVLYWGGFYVLVQLLSKGWRYSIVETGLRLVPLSIPAVFVGRLAGRLIDRHGFKRTLMPAALLYGLTLLCVAALTGSGSNMVVWVPTALILGACVNCLFIGANSAGSVSAPVEALSSMTGLVQTMIRVGGVIGTALVVSIVGDVSAAARPESFRSPLLALAGFTLVVASVVLLLRERRPQPIDMANTSPAADGDADADAEPADTLRYLPTRP